MESAHGVPGQYRAVLSPLTDAPNVTPKAPDKPSGEVVEVHCETLKGVPKGEYRSRGLAKDDTHGNALLSTSWETLRRFRRTAVHEVPAYLKNRAKGGGSNISTAPHLAWLSRLTRIVAPAGSPHPLTPRCIMQGYEIE